ncbi:hypothetical protein Sango_2850000 [Sesamum angolense]|uniref:Uncharacterized protein n=1 Tax=Sesamum angolense TaxID=2727404 RepID=A0AAE1VZI3_9LAMI|nr:hypothetical protein Sango_2850000 [Sesamum angolense]
MMFGALDDTYIKVRVPTSEKGRYRTCKDNIVVNVLGVCDRNMKFTYVLTRWEGNDVDSRVLCDIVNRPNGLRVQIGEHVEDVVDVANSVRIEEPINLEYPINLEDLLRPDYDSPPQVNVGVGQNDPLSFGVPTYSPPVNGSSAMKPKTSSLGTLATRIGFEHDESKKHCKVFNALEDIRELLLNERMWVAKQL